ncbi:MAG TPA: metal ABC transporter permease [Gammaproteobacteria bacterium]|nr:metal ABC transporter permease [Gammaproteobacteria bacterium]
MSLDFMARAVVAGMGIAVVAGPLGSIIVWRRMANFGDALAHSTLLGLCFALLLNIHIYIGLTSVCILVACSLALFSRQQHLANDTILCMLAYATLAIGLILATVLKGIRVDLLGYLYGDILSVNNTDLIWIYCVDAVVFLSFVKIWRPILSMTVHEDLAKVEGVPVLAMQWILVVIMAVVFSVAMKLVGILLITALLIIPASAARQISTTPEKMAVIASIVGMISVFGGIQISFNWDWPAGPAIVVVAMVLFMVSALASSVLTRCKA